MAGKKTRRGRTATQPPRPARRRVTLEDLLSAIRMDPENLTPRLVLAEHYLCGDMGERILEAFDGFSSPGAFPDIKTESLCHRLRAYGHAHRQQLIEAEEAASKALRVDPESLDALFVLAFVHLSLREYEEAANTADRFIQVYRFIQRTKVDPKQFAANNEHLAQVHNFVGSAAFERREFEPAEHAFEQAIKADPTNHLPYLNLCRLYRQTNQPDRANTVIERGLTTCSQVHELRLVADSLHSKSTVSACMIVKNEEELLPGCLESIRGWVDDIVVVDTGSTDKTVAIAESYGARVFHQEWEGDFSKHRNYSIGEATGDWVFIIDADERMTDADIPSVRRCLADPQAKIIAVNVLNVGGKFDEQVTFLPSVRFFRRELGLRYEGIVHNQLRIDAKQPVLRTGVTIRHLGYGLSPEKLAAKAARTIELLDKQLAQNPKDAFALFNYAQVLLGLGISAHVDNAKKIKDAAGRAVKLTRPEVRGERHIHLMALYQMALLNFLTAKYPEAGKYASKALSYKHDYLDPILLLGHINLRTGDFDLAEQFYCRYLAVQATYSESAETDDIIVIHPRSAHHAWYSLGVIAEHRHDWATAQSNFDKVLDVMPEFADTNARLGYMKLRAGLPDEADECFLRQLKIQPDSHVAAIGCALVNFERGRVIEAEDLVEAALASCPADAPEILLHASTLEQIDRRAEAMRFVDKAFTAENLSGARGRTAADLYFRLGRYDRAAELYLALTKAGEADGSLLNDLGGCYYKMSDFPRAEEWYRKAVEADQPPAIALRNLGLTRVRLDRTKEALVVLERYLDLAPEQMEIVHLVGDLYARLGQDRAAIPFYEKCLQVNPKDRLALFSLSECYLRLGHRDSALVGYRRVLDLDRDFEPASRRLTELAEPVRIP